MNGNLCGVMRRFGRNVPPTRFIPEPGVQTVHQKTIENIMNTESQTPVTAPPSAPTTSAVPVTSQPQATVAPVSVISASPTSPKPAAPAGVKAPKSGKKNKAPTVATKL